MITDQKPAAEFPPMRIGLVWFNDGSIEEGPYNVPPSENYIHEAEHQAQLEAHKRLSDTIIESLQRAQESYDRNMATELEAVTSERDELREELEKTKHQMVNTYESDMLKILNKYNRAVLGLRKIAGQDYRGNRPTECVIAYNALKELGE